MEPATHVTNLQFIYERSEFLLTLSLLSSSCSDGPATEGGAGGGTVFLCKLSITSQNQPNLSPVLLAYEPVDSIPIRNIPPSINVGRPVSLMRDLCVTEA